MKAHHFKKFGKYTIIKKLASGGMADILLASDLSPTGFGRFVVIKRALSKFSNNEEFKDMFKNEGKVACNLQHRNITPIYEFGIEKDQFFLSMEYISGKNLREFTKRLQTYKRKIDIPNVVYVIKEVAAGLSYAHNAIDSNTGQPLNLIHRDVSPQNIMISFDGEIKLIDFGIVKIANTNLTRAGHLKGKFSYMSPEQAQGDVALDERTDIFCLGIILWELLANKRLFASSNEMLALKKVKQCQVPSIQQINPHVPTELSKIVTKTLQKNKNLRYENAEKLAQKLNLFLNKNYPEYTHYDFISLIKQTYKKQIIEERENLKTYSAQFKQYINSLNIEGHSNSSVIDLNIPDLSTVIETNQLQTKSLPLTENLPSQNSEMLSYDNSQVSGQESYTLPKTKETMEKDKSTLIQKREDETYTRQTKSIEKTTHTKSMIQRLIAKTLPGANKLRVIDDGSVDVNTSNNIELLKDPADHLKSTQSAFSTKSTSSSLYDRSKIFQENYKESGKTTKSKPLMIYLSIGLVIGFAIIIYMLLSNKDMIALIKTTIKSPKKVYTQAASNTKPQSVAKQQRHISSLTPAAVKERKIFISSKPSGASILINDQFSSKFTPSWVTVTSSQNSTITVEKKGYTGKKIVFDPRQQKNNHLDVHLSVDPQHKTPPPSEVYIIQ